MRPLNGPQGPQQIYQARQEAALLRMCRAIIFLGSSLAIMEPLPGPLPMYSRRFILMYLLLTDRLLLLKVTL
jgi:hypothetical protein